MEIKIINPSGLMLTDIDKRVLRIKLLILNEENEILLCNVLGKYSFVGGHVDNNETIEIALVRELKEETGIELTDQKFKPFFKIERWNENHFNTGIKCLSDIYYYLIYTNKQIDIEKMDLTNDEKEKNFFLEYMNIDEFYNYLQIENKCFSNELYSEMFYVLNYYFENINRGKSDDKKLQKRL